MSYSKYSTNQVTWTTVNFPLSPSPNCWIQGDPLGVDVFRSISYGNGLWVAGGFSGQIANSTDGSTWTTVNSNFGNTRINQIAYGNGLWVAGGYSGQIRTSTNGSTWTTVTSNFGTSRVRSIAYGNGVFIAVGDGPTMRTSTNGSTWTTISITGVSHLFSIAYGNGAWVVGEGTSKFLTSTNGSTWTTVSTPQFNLYRQIVKVSYGNGKWIASDGIGQMRISTNNGATWSTVEQYIFSSGVNGIAYGNGLWLASSVLSREAGISTDGTTWTTIITSFAFRSIAYNNGIWVAGSSGSNEKTTDPTIKESILGNILNIETINNTTAILTSAGQLWKTQREIDDIENFKRCYNTGNIVNIKQLSSFENNFIIITDNDTVYLSNDLINLYTTYADTGINRHIKNNNISLLLKNSGEILQQSGSTWTTISTGINDNFVNGTIRNNGGTYEYIIQGNNALYRSTDLTTWTTISKPPASSVNDIISKS